MRARPPRGVARWPSICRRLSYALGNPCPLGTSKKTAMVHPVSLTLRFPRVARTGGLPAAGLLLGCGMLLFGCADQKLAVLPPAGVDLTGHWKLDEADSDDPQRVMQAQIFGTDTQTGPISGGRRGGRRGGEGSGSPGTGQDPTSAQAAAAAPPMPPASAVGAGLRWPGKELEIKQIDGVAAFSSDGRNRVYQPAAPVKSRHGEPQQACGWDGKTLVVEAQPDDDRPPVEVRYSLSEDGQELVQNVHFKRGNSRELTLTRVWDRVQ